MGVLLCIWNVMAHVQKPDFVFRRNRWVHLNQWGCQFSQLLAAEVCASVVVMLRRPCSEAECKSTGYPLHSPVSPSLPVPCITVRHHISPGLYHLTVPQTVVTTEQFALHIWQSGTINLWTLYKQNSVNVSPGNIRVRPMPDTDRHLILIQQYLEVWKHNTVLHLIGIA